MRPEFVAIQPHPEAAMDLVFSATVDSGRRDNIIRRIVEPLGHEVEPKGKSESVAPDGRVFYGDVVGVRPPLGMNALVSISANLGAQMSVVRGSNPKLD